MQLDVSLANIWQSFGVWATNFSVFVMLPTNIFDNDFRKIIHRKTFFFASMQHCLFDIGIDNKTLKIRSQNNEIIHQCCEHSKGIRIESSL